MSFFHSACFVVLDTPFCVLKACVELRRHVSFAAALIKKLWCWPACVAGNAVAGRIVDTVGSFDAISDVLDDIIYNIWCMKELDYVMSLIATWGYCHITDIHNKLCHKLLSLEATWRKSCWVIHVHRFLLSVIEVITYLLLEHWVYCDDDNLPKTSTSTISWHRCLSTIIMYRRGYRSTFNQLENNTTYV